MEIKIIRMCTLSTAHITEKTNDLLAEWTYPSNESPIIVYEKEGGYFIHVPDDFDYEEMDLPEDIETIVAFAIGCGIDWICLDRDGSIESMFPTYEW